MTKKAGLTASMTSQVLIEKSLIGWKEYELEVMRDLKDNVVIICSIENIDPMGVHTGDSVTVAPAQTLTDKEYQRLRDASVAIIREVGVECGGSNVQFGVNPADGEVMVIEMNPRVSRSSALASKATGFPIAKMAAKLAIGYTLDCIPNDITEKTPASFEPSIDYVVTKIPRFAFEKFPGSSPVLTTQMKSVGEAMAIGRTFQESFQKALRSLEVGLDGWSSPKGADFPTNEELRYNLRTPNPDRLVAVWYAMDAGFTTEEIISLTKMDPWFVSQLRCLKDVGDFVKSQGSLGDLTAGDWRQIKSRGFSDSQIGRLAGLQELEVRRIRKAAGCTPVMKRVDTCAAEFEADTPYMYSTYDGEDECAPNTKGKVLILGGGPNRIGQGIEFDYCCCHAAFSLSAEGYETIMMNSNPETVSTDYDTSDRLYFEPLTVEDVVDVLEAERPEGIIVQFGGQTPLKLAKPLQKYLEENPIPAASGKGNVRIWGTSPDSIDAAEDREQFEALLKRLGIDQPAGGIARSEEEAVAAAAGLGYPVMVRPSYVLGGRAMEVVYNEQNLRKYINTAVAVDPDQPVLDTEREETYPEVRRVPRLPSCRTIHRGTRRTRSASRRSSRGASPSGTIALAHKRREASPRVLRRRSSGYGRRKRWCGAARSGRWRPPGRSRRSRPPWPPGPPRRGAPSVPLPPPPWRSKSPPAAVYVSQRNAVQFCSSLDFRGFGLGVQWAGRERRRT